MYESKKPIQYIILMQCPQEPQSESEESLLCGHDIFSPSMNENAMRIAQEWTDVN
jgi:hypothetical protein